MTISWEPTGVLMFFLVFLRLSGFFLPLPFFSRPYCPPSVQVLLSLILAALLAPGASLASEVFADDLIFGALVAFGLRDFLVGFLIGFAALLVIMAAQMAGQYLDFQMGFFTAAQIDPRLGERVPLTGNFLYVVALVLFLGINGHHHLLNILNESLELVPPGTRLSASGVAGLFPFMSWMFLASFRISVPILAVLFVATVALGIVGRTMPQLNVFVLGIPLRILLGMLVLLAIVPLYVTYFQTLISDQLGALLRLLEAW